MGSSSVNEVLTSSRTNESDNEGEVGLEQSPSFPGQLVSYPPGSDAFREFCKAKAAVGGKWAKYVEFAGRQFRGCMVAVGEEYFYLLADLEVEKRDRGIDESIAQEYFDGDVRSDLPEGFLCYLSQLEYRLSLPFTNLANGIMNANWACPVQLSGNMWEVKGNCLKRDDEEPLDLWFRTIKQSMKSTVERKESLLDEVAEEETELELVFEGLSLRVDEGKRQVSGEEARTNLSKTPRTSSSAQPNPVKPSMIALKYLKKRMLKALPASGTNGSGEVTKDKRRVEPSGESGEKVVEGRSAIVDDLKEVVERARLAAFLGEEDTSKMVAHLVKGIWLSIEEEKSKLKKANVELEKELARSRTDALKEVRQLKASHAVAIGQLQVETKANLNEIVEERDRLGRHLIMKGYSEEEVDAIKAGTYTMEEDEEEAEAVGIVDGLDGVFHQTVLNNQGDGIELPEGGSEKVEVNDSEIKKGLKKLAEVTELVEKLRSRVNALAVKVKQADTAQYCIQALVQLEERFRSDLKKCRNELERMQRKFVEKDGELRVA
ncbi:hypothetical protein GIB67_025477 [Kingdonia uniflora]|uniref:Uncharacterized protein n=1 Tax=Kingdonia uniflora TaxID=39325 RepID=A0A7J7PD26_9MAGN|nr:hypothetical protein GIB67_025477 [Kingdonia uniflora]